MLRRLRYAGRLVGVINDHRGGRLLIHYGDLVHTLPPSFGDPLPHCERIVRHRQVFVDARVLEKLAGSDRLHRSCQLALIDLLYNLKEDMKTCSNSPTPQRHSTQLGYTA